MSSKDKDKIHRSSGDRESSRKREPTKSNDNGKLKILQEQKKTKEDKDSAKYKSQIEEINRRKSHNIEEEYLKKKYAADVNVISSQKNKKEVENKTSNDDEREERRRRRKENEIMKKENDLRSSLEAKERSERRIKKSKEDEEDNFKTRVKSSKDESNDKYTIDKESRKKLKSDKDEFATRSRPNKVESSNRHKKDKEEYGNKDKKDIEESRTKYMNDKDDNDKERKDKEESRTKHRNDKDEYGNKEKRDKEESRTKHRNDKDEYSNKERRDKEESRTKHRKDNEESNTRRIEKEESRSKHRTIKDDYNSKHRSEMEPDKKSDDIKSKSLNKANATGDGRGNRTSLKKETFQSDENMFQKNKNVDYEEDFDDYNDDDFEESNSPSTEESSEKIIQIESALSYQSNVEPIMKEKSENKIIQNQDGIHTSFINFKLAQKKCSNDVVANKMLSRAFDLSRLIEFDKSTFDILDVAPVLEHSKYMSMFGRAGCQHGGSQTGDDNMARESQTEVIEKRTLWSQHPPLDDEGCVRITMDTSVTNHSKFPLSNTSDKTALEMLTETEVSSTSLIDILDLIDRILEEEDSPEVATKISSTQKGQQLMSLGYNKYCWEDSFCTLGTFASGNSCIFASIHQQSNKGEDVNANSSKSFVSIWRVSSNCREPQRMLSWPSYSTQKSQITSLIFSPDPSSSHVIGGLESGLIALWDLREHCLVTDEDGREPPAYLTGVLNDDIIHTHKEAVIALHTSCTEIACSSYQLLSLDTLGNISIWIVSSLIHSGVWALASGSLADLNLRPGARSRMSIVASIPLFSGITNMTCSITCMTVDPTNSNQIFIGTTDGKIIHHERTTQKSSNERVHHNGRIYGSLQNFETASVTQIDFYPFFEPYILAGYNDGSLKIFVVGRVEPLLSLYDKHRNPVMMCRWSRSHPAIFFDLDTKGNLSVWNVLINLYTPVMTQTLNGYIGFDLSSDSRWHIKEDKTVNNKARLLIWALGGSIEVHELHPSLVQVELDDCFKTCSLFQSLL